MAATSAQNLQGVKIYINPGHGGYDSDDRNVVIAPFKSGDQAGFWESKSNLDKGFALRELLQSAGATVLMSRTTNTTADDLPLSQIVASANQAGVDFMLSIHSNAGNGVANHVLMLHVGLDPTDTQIYNTFNITNPAHKKLSDDSRAISTEIAKNLYTNQLTTWSSGYSVRGDKTFARISMGWSDGYGVLRSLYVPGVISEGSMHDYIPETYRLMNLEYKWLEAWNFYKSFCNYFNGGEIPTGNIAGSVRDSRIKLESTYNKFKGRDEMLPLNGATITLVETGEKYAVDSMQNGVFVFKNLSPGVYHIKAEKEGYYSTTQEMVVSKHTISWINLSMNRIRNTPPEIINYLPKVEITDSVDASVSILFEFNWDMDEVSTSAAFSISPHVAGKISFEDSQYKMRFTPDKPLEKSTLYTVTLAKSASHPDNLSMVDDFSFRFVTKSRNRLALISSYPGSLHSKVHYNSPSFRLIFDKKLNTSNLQTSILVLDSKRQVVSKNARSVENNKIMLPFGSTYFKLIDNLIPGENYFLVVDGAVKDEVGVSVVESIEIPFTAVDALSDQQTVVDAFENAVYLFDPIKSAGTSNASAALSSSVKLAGNSSMRLQATLTGDGYAIFNPAASLTFTNEEMIGLHVFGDMSANILELELKAGDDMRYLQVCTTGFFGWEFFEVDLSELAPATVYSLTGIRVKNASVFEWGSSVDLYFDNLLKYNNPRSSVPGVDATKLLVYPIPANAWLKTDAEGASLHLFTLTGQLIRSVTSPMMMIDDLPHGSYLIRIDSGNSSNYQKIILK
jgi:hypothetical protein